MEVIDFFKTILDEYIAQGIVFLIIYLMYRFIKKKIKYFKNRGVKRNGDV